MRGAVGMGVLLGLAGCALSLDGLSGGPADPAPADAGSETTTAPPDGSVPRSDAMTTPDASAPLDAGLAANGDFENGCAGWGNFQAILTADPDAHGGAQACRVCSDGTSVGPSYSLLLNFTQGPQPVGASFHAEAWVRLASPTAQTAHATLRLARTTPFAFLEQAQSSDVVLTNSWMKITQDFTVSKADGDYVEFIIEVAPTGAGHCVLVDDVSIQRTN